MSKSKKWERLRDPYFELMLGKSSGSHSLKNKENRSQRKYGKYLEEDGFSDVKDFWEENFENN